LETYALSALLVAFAEMGDRTQLLAIMLASRYRKPLPILLGILAATLANHAFAALAGFYLSGLLQAAWFKYAISVSFLAMTLWALIPDKADEEGDPERLHMGVFVTTAVAFFWWRSATRHRSPRGRSPRVITTSCSSPPARPRE